MPRLKRFLSEVKEGVVPQTIWHFADVGHTQDAKKEVLQVMQFGDEESVFITPKPTELVSRVLRLSKGALILDSFAGSGTTAHAVLKMNAQDGGNRKFILVECEDYADTLTAERVRRVISGYPFQGTQRETLYEKKLTWTEVKKGDKLVQDADDQRKFAEQSGDWDKVSIKVEDGVLKVIGERKLEETAPGLGGSFTYCTLGEPLRLQSLLEGERLPSREALGDWLLYVSGASSQPEPAPDMGEDLQRLFLGKRGGICYWLIYEPALEVLRRLALTLDLARAIGATDRNVEHRVFGPQKFVGNKLLRAENLRIEFAQIPYALFRAGAE
jgi:adenine-specific DNA-methyltransferase